MGRNLNVRPAFELWHAGLYDPQRVRELPLDFARQPPEFAQDASLSPNRGETLKPRL